TSRRVELRGLLLLRALARFGRAAPVQGQRFLKNGHPESLPGSGMTRIALLSSEPVRARMAGIGIRYLELARRLPRPGIEVVLVSPAEPAETKALPGLEGIDVRQFERGRLASLLADCHGAVAQGQLANDLVLELPALPVAIDLYDPWLIENFA